MNSRSALVTAAFLVRSPLTARARSSRSGSIDRFVAMCSPPHIILHIAAGGRHLFRWGREPASDRRPARVRGMSPETPRRVCWAGNEEPGIAAATRLLCRRHLGDKIGAYHSGQMGEPAGHFRPLVRAGFSRQKNRQSLPQETSEKRPALVYKYLIDILFLEF